MKLTEEIHATAVKAPTTAMMAGCPNFRTERGAEDPFAPGLLSALTEGSVARVSKKTSVSPLIHLSMSPIVILGIPKGAGHFGEAKPWIEAVPLGLGPSVRVMARSTPLARRSDLLDLSSRRTLIGTCLARPERPASLIRLWNPQAPD